MLIITYPFRLALLMALWVLTLGASVSASWAETSAAFSSPAVTARLISAQNGVTEGAQTISAGLDLTLGEGWKTYWRSPGEVGFAPEVDWSTSENVANVEFLWPAPERFTAFGIENFGYSKEVVFPLMLRLERPGEPFVLNTSVTLLTCSTVCVPQNFDLALSLGPKEGIDQLSADRISRFVARVPVDENSADINTFAANLNADNTELTVSLRGNTPFGDPDVFPELGSGTALGKPDIRLGDGGRLLWASFPVLSLNETTLGDPVLTVTDGPGRAFTLTTVFTDAPLVPPFTIAQIAPGIDQIAWIALIAVLGGLILNVMPCVLPVLSIKLSSAIKQSGRSQLAVRAGFLAAAAGVMVFMWALAAILFTLQRVGITVGWGLQFQNPVFLALMFVVLAVFSANLFGLFEISLPSAMQTRMARAGGTSGYGADFMTGIFGAVMATPCSAPFLGTAIAFALAGSGVDIVIVFTSLGIGLAAPYLVVAAAPQLVTMLPKPGPWMIGLKIFLGVLLVVTAAWLIWVLMGVAGPGSAMTVAALTVVLLVILAWHRAPAPLRTSGIIVFLALPLIAAGTLSQDAAPKAAEAEVINWVAFDRSKIAGLVSQGQIVFVDVTADWCLTCKANKALVLDREPVATRLNQVGVTSMQADWTRPDPAISRYLESFNRYGIPFNVVYGPGAPNGIALSEILSSAAVIEALDQATIPAQIAQPVQN